MPIQFIKRTETRAVAASAQVCTLRRPIVDAASKVMLHNVSLRAGADNFFGLAWAYFMDSDGVFFIPIGLGNKIVPNLLVGTSWKGIVEWPAEWRLLIGCVTNEDATRLDAVVAYEVVPLVEYHRWW